MSFIVASGIHVCHIFSSFFLGSLWHSTWTTAFPRTSRRRLRQGNSSRRGRRRWATMAIASFEVTEVQTSLISLELKINWNWIQLDKKISAVEHSSEMNACLIQFRLVILYPLCVTSWGAVRGNERRSLHKTKPLQLKPNPQPQYFSNPFYGPRSL